jgi:hypothetical protein
LVLRVTRDIEPGVSSAIHERQIGEAPTASEPGVLEKDRPQSPEKLVGVPE